MNLADSADRVGESDEQAYARAMRDPEIQSIMSDPVFQNILQQAQNEPASLGQHMKNPDIANKINKLVRAVRGFISHSVGGEAVVDETLLCYVCV